MKKIILLPLLLASSASLFSCTNNEKTIVVGASPSPHAQILSCDVVQNYVKSQGYTLQVKIYQDYVTPNKALNYGGIDANYFQHIPYLEEKIASKGYDLSAVAKIHYESLYLYSLEPVVDFTNAKISIVNDVSNVERAFQLLKNSAIIFI